MPTAPSDRGLLRPTDPATDSAWSPTRSPWSRRSVLRAGATACAALALVSACGTNDPEPVDVLEAPAERARNDAAAITAAISRYPERADALAVMAAERGAHADALTAEIDRLNPPTTTTTTSSAETPPPQVTPPSLDEIRSALLAAADEAGALVPTTSGYRCGLLGSIAAACRTQVAIALP
ncbi:hypothetical protein [Millisia brevis]|uniref:hypothetical protein n=1 Tax=Millisia brevis TaxID=264148 RepID=UPI0012ED21A9|nr:hypothetical protein [Millisia brevis]